MSSRISRRNAPSRCKKEQAAIGNVPSGRQQRAILAYAHKYRDAIRLRSPLHQEALIAVTRVKTGIAGFDDSPVRAERTLTQRPHFEVGQTRLGNGLFDFFHCVELKHQRQSRSPDELSVLHVAS